MAASRKGAFARNITSNLAGYAVNVVVAVVLTPFVAGELGKTVWGLWAVIISLTGYYGLLDLGIRSAVGQYVTRYYAQDDMDGVNRTLNTAMVLMLAVAALAVVITVILGATLPMWVDLAAEDPASSYPVEQWRLGFDAHSSAPIAAEPVQWALIISGLGIAASLPMALWSTVTYARERFDIANGIGVAESLLRLMAVWWALSAGHGVIGLACATAGTQLVGWSARMIVAYRLMPGLRLALQLFDRSAVRELGSFGCYNVLVNAADRIVISTDLIIVAAVYLEAVPLYASGALLIPYFTELVQRVTWTMTPYATSCDATGDHAALRRLLLAGTRGSLFLAVVIATGLLLTGDAFLHLWLPPDLLDSDTYAPAAVILTILTWATLVRCASSCGRQILFGMRRMRLLAGLSSIEALLNLGLSLWLIHAVGTEGVALGTLIPVVLVYGLGQNILLTRSLGVPLAAFLGEVARASVPTMAAMYGADLLIDRWLAVESWPTLVAKALLLLVPALVIGYSIVMNSDERQALRRRLRGASGAAAAGATEA